MSFPHETMAFLLKTLATHDPRLCRIPHASQGILDLKKERALERDVPTLFLNQLLS
jgi:hypothetical protein